MSNLLEHLETLTDSRHAKGKRHSQTTTLAIVLLGMLCGHVHIKARFAKQYHPQLALALPLPKGKTPSIMTIQRLSLRIDVEELCEVFNRWMKSYYQAEAVAIDGKSINSTVSEAHGKHQNFASIVSFFGQNTHLVWQLGVLESQKQHEIQKVQQLLAAFTDKATFTLDALHTQKNA